MQGRMKLMPCAQLMNDALSQNTMTCGSIAFFTAQKTAIYVYGLVHVIQNGICCRHSKVHSSDTYSGTAADRRC